LLLQKIPYTQQLLIGLAFASVFALGDSAVCKLVVNDSAIDKPEFEKPQLLGASILRKVD
jgi:hypothetical protein